MIIEQSLIIAFIVLFFHATTWDGDIFEGIKKIIKPEGMLYKPIYGCPICMVPWWGTLIYWLFFHVGFVDWVLTIGTAAGINVIAVVLLHVKEFCTEYVKQKLKKQL